MNWYTLLNTMTNKWMMLAMVILFSIMSLVLFETPVLAPNGFPYAAITLNSKQIAQSSNQQNVTFEDKTLAAGLNFIHQQGDEQIAGIDEALGAGACAADFNNDGWVDLFIVNGSGHTRYYGKRYWWETSQGNALFINDRGKRFHDATVTSGLEKQIWGMGCLSGDFDNDGDIDLLLTGKDIKLLYQNDGAGVFTDVTQDSGISEVGWSTSATAADFNHDGLLDIYIGNFVDFNKGKKTFEANSQFASEKKGVFDPSLYEAQANQLYQNLGGLKFKEVAVAMGVENFEGRTLDVSWQDFNLDGFPDLLVTNDRGTGSNVAYINEGGKHFVAGGQALRFRSALGNRGIASGDLDNDDDIDFVIASTAGESTIALLKQNISNELDKTKLEYRDLAREIGIGSNELLSHSSWSPLIQDFNGDGLSDLFISGGMLEPDQDATKVPQGQSKQLLLNNGSGQFYDLSAQSGQALLDTQSARGSVSADFDNDGDVDLYVVHNNDLGQYLVNQSAKKHWLGVKLVGTKSNRDAIGAIVRLFSAPKIYQRTISSGEGFLSDSDKRLFFGLGENAQVDKIVITWPSGTEQTVGALTADRYWQITENNSQPIELGQKDGHVDASLAQVLRLKLGEDQPVNRVHYINTLTQAENTPQKWAELNIAANDENALVRLETIKSVYELNTPESLNILLHGLEDPETANVLKAIEGLRLAENEISIRWLLRLFAHQAAEVKIAVAECFAFFFQEEEAMVHRKYLAIPYLIRALDDVDPKVRQAAARALANAERFRGMHALIEHLHDEDDTVRAEIVRTLGLIRQGEAKAKLTQLIQDQAQPAGVMANIFIALNRLEGGEEAFKTLTAFVLGQDMFANITLETRLATLEHIIALNNKENVLQVEQLQQLVNTAFKKLEFNNPASPDNSVVISHWINILQNGTDQISLNWLLKQTTLPNDTIRVLVFKSLFARQQSDGLAILKRAWQDQSVTVRQWALQGLLHKKMALSAEDYRKIMHTPELQSTLLRSGAEDNYPIDAIQLTKALNEISPAIKAGSNSQSTDSELGLNLSRMQNICVSGDSELQKFCSLSLFANRGPEYRELRIKLLQGQEYPLSLRQSLLEHYDLASDSEAINTLFAITQVKKDPLRHATILKLFTLNSEALIEFASKIANNVAENSELRYQAVEFLVRQGHAEAREILYR